MLIHRFSSFFSLGVFLFIALNLPTKFTDNARSCSVASLMPIWQIAHKFKNYLQDRPWVWNQSRCFSKEEIQNQLDALKFHSHLAISQDWLEWSRHLEDQLVLLKQYEKEAKSDFFQRRVVELSRCIEDQFNAVPARVIYRDPSSWSSSLWIQVGEKDNESQGKVIIALNSPVVVGSSLVGVIEFVGKSQSRVRLITDSGLVPSVRVARGSLQDWELGCIAKSLYDRIQGREDLPFFEPQKSSFIESLAALQKKFGKEEEYLAKGQLHGSSSPLWRARAPLLKGIGFNYEYKDAEGLPRDLINHRTRGSQEGTSSIIKPGDLLITSGFDGVFPAGLQVGIVTGIKPFAEGEYSYEIEAKPSVRNVNDLHTVFVLPPIISDG